MTTEIKPEQLSAKVCMKKDNDIESDSMMIWKENNLSTNKNVSESNFSHF